MFGFRARYSRLQSAWRLLIAATFFALYSATAASILPSSELPEPFWVGAVGAGLVAAVGWFVVSFQQTREWRAAGRAAGLTPDRSGSSGRSSVDSEPVLAGVVDGRRVRARTEPRGREDLFELFRMTKPKDTIVETELDRPLESGVELHRGDVPSESSVASDRRRARADADALDALDRSEDTVDALDEPVKLDEEFVVAAGSEPLAREIVADDAREALLALDDHAKLFVGDAAASMFEAVPDEVKEAVSGVVSGLSDAPGVGGAVEARRSEFTESARADASTASVRTRGLASDPDELERLARAVVAAADATAAATEVGEWGAESRAES